MNVSNPFDMPAAYVAAVSRQRVPQKGRISVTELLQPPQLRALWLSHYGEIEMVVGVDDHDTFHGNAVHEFLRQHAQGQTLAEHQMSYRFGEMVVHGTPDHLDILFAQGAHLIDWKTTKLRALKYDRAEWEAQCNLYAHLLRLNGYKVDGVTVWAFIKDWDRARLVEPDYPRSHAVRRTIPLWDPDDAHDFLMQRLELHERAQEGELIPCSEDDKWQRRTYAVWSLKGEPQKPHRVFDVRDDAVAWMVSNTKALADMADWWEIDVRIGPPVRCESYCPVAQFCPQRAQERADDPSLGSPNVQATGRIAALP